MDSYKSLCDDFYVTLTLSTEMELPNNRETVLHYFERVRKQYPSMQKFYNRSQGHFVLEEDSAQVAGYINGFLNKTLSTK